MASAVVAIGIDAEPNERLPDGVLGVIANPEEQVWLDELDRLASATHWDRLLFSAKEAVYKTWFPLARCSLGFEDAVVTVDTSRSAFHARLLIPGPAVEGRPLAALEGRWLVRDGLIVTVVTLPRSGYPDA
jgi:4'-phosphopantetheinyl transferase EntD